jgi:hypothetical protein
MTRAKAWPEKADALMNDLIADTNLLLARQRTFTLKFYASILTALYVLGFLGLGFRVWQSTGRVLLPVRKKQKAIRPLVDEYPLSRPVVLISLPIRFLYGTHFSSTQRTE